MQSNPPVDDRAALANAAHSKSYDPSAPLRAMMQPPPPPPAQTGYPTGDPNMYNPVPPQGNPFANNGPTGTINRIPQYFYPRYNEPSAPHPNEPRYDRQPTFVEGPLPPQIPSYAQPIPLSMDPYLTDQYYPYPTPYLVPLTNNVHVDSAPPPQEQVKTDILASHKRDADLSRLEVYHFTPKQSNVPALPSAPSTQPIVQYHMYSYPQGGQPPGPPQPYQAPPYSQPWYGNPPYGPEPYVPPIEKRARGIQTEPPTTKNRGVSPMYTMDLNPRQEREYSPVQHVVAYTDRYDPPAPRQYHQRSHDRLGSRALDDCRCLNCRQEREREKVLNYYPE